MRGTPIESVGEEFLRRFIPAYAGNTSGWRSKVSVNAVHPRVCGEHPRYSERRNDNHRFIPAYAGNTFSVIQKLGIMTVHPRVCGEHRPRRPRRLLMFGGSSPRMRGTLDVGRSDRVTIRFIPAYAGNT